MPTFASKVIQFNKDLSFKEKLPKGIRIMNPFSENKEIIPITEIFYKKFYNDNKKRKLILEINPGRLGAGATGIPFTDTKRASQFCGIKIESVTTHEPSSVFIYDMIEKYGGAKKFYKEFYINSICPLGFTVENINGRQVNCNYYDFEELYSKMENFIVSSLKKQIKFGIDSKTCYVLGKKNAKFLSLINKKESLFDSIVALDHPRYIEQYKSKFKEKYISDYLDKLKS